MIKGIIYILKRRYGFPLDIYRESNESVDILTGRRTRTRTKQSVKRAIVFPSDITRLPAIARANALGGTQNPNSGVIDVDTRIVLIDLKDANIDLRDYIVIENKRYDIKTLEIYQNEAYYLVLKEYKGSILYKILDIRVQDFITLAQRATHA